MYYLSARINMCEKWKEIRDLIKETCEVWMYCKENLDEHNPHMHWYMEMAKTPTWFRSVLRKQFGLVGGNADYSIKSCKERYPIKYIAYLTKQGKYRQRGIPESVMVDALEYDERVKQELKEKKQKNRNQKEKIIEYVDNKNMNKNYMAHHEWIEEIINYYKDNEILFREFAVISMADTLFLKYNASGVDHLKRRILMKLKQI